MAESMLAEPIQAEPALLHLEDEPRDVDLLCALVATPSPSGDERAAVCVLVSWMAERGFEAFVDEAGNAVGILEPLPGPETVRELLLLGHIDTVGGWPTVRTVDGVLYGRGSVDAKGPLAAFAAAAASLGQQRGWRVVVAGAVEEEAATSKGARRLLIDRRPDLVVIGEPTGWQRIALGYKGRLLAEINVRRPLSHTAGPDAGVADLAVGYWNRLRARIDDINAPRERIWDQIQPSLRGFNSAGDGLTETATLRMGFRLPLDFPPAAMEQLARDLLDRDEELHFWGPEVAHRSDKNNPLVRAFLGAIRGQEGEPGFVLKTGTSDMNVVAPVWGCPIVAYGPGDSSLDHTPDEHVELDEWTRGVSVLRDAIGRLVRG